jgi:hypothetical protein
MEHYTGRGDAKNTSVDIGPTSKILTNLVVIPFGVPICLENVLAIIVLLRSSRLIYQVRILSVNLATTDCLAGLVLSIPDDIFGNCLLKKYFTAPFINVSLITVTLFNIDRCCSLKYALRYYEIVTPKVLKMACLLSWLLGILISYLMFFDPSHPLGIFCGLMFQTPFSAVSYSAKVFQVFTITSNLLMYMYMSLSLFISSRSIFGIPSIKTVCTCKSKENPPTQNVQHINPSIKTVCTCKSKENPSTQNVQPSKISTRNLNSNNGQSVRNQTRVVKKLAVITGFFIFCCTPYFLFQIIPDVDFSRRSMRTLHTIFAGIMFLNSAINPVLYVWRFTESRYQLKRILYCWNAEKLRKLESERKAFFATYQINITS